jgi:F0F1-type ATP synthase assembly protein I
MTETKTTSPTPGVSNKPATAPSGSSPSNDFVAAVLGMSWQLAVVVLVPVVGGFELDKAFATSPLLVIIGFIVAMAGFALIVRRQMQIFTPPAGHTVHPEKKKEPIA